MRALELVAIFLLLVSIARYAVPRTKRPPWLLYAPILSALTLILHAFIEGTRWQMAPAYVLCALLLAISAPALLKAPPMQAPPLSGARRFFSVVAILLGFVVWLFAAALPYALPVFELPKPTGIYAVGTTQFDWTDNARIETLAPKDSSVNKRDNEHRSLTVQVWYPANLAANAAPMRYWPNAKAAGAALSQAGGLPNFLFNHLALVETHSYRDATLIADKTFPIVVFSHGIWGIASQNTVQMEELASHGYVVFSIAHPYESLATHFSDGRVVSWSPEHRKQFGEAGRNAYKEGVKPFSETKDSQQQETLLRKVFELQHMAMKTVSVWTDDTRFVVDQIERLNIGEIPSPFKGRLNANRVGVMGHSFGGSTAGQFCAIDKRCKAGINMDGLQWGTVLDQPIASPFMIMHSDDAARAQGETRMNDLIYGKGNNPLVRIQIKGSLHGNYSDFGFASPWLNDFGAMGAIDPQRMEIVINRLILAFFGKHLRDEDSPLLKTADKFPEVELQSRNL